MHASDHELLRQYARDGVELAFAELVRRHVNLVYSAARRQTHSPQLAEDVTQSVFIDLARAAKHFAPRTPVVAWLHLVTRRTAIDVIRRESRRQLREQTAAELFDMNPPPTPWSRLEPQLDEALAALEESERAAVLLRFFENKTLREVGETLGTSDEAARKRVSRALDRLRVFFARRGVAVTAAGLASELSAHAIHIVPANLTAAILSTATTAAFQAAAFQVTKTLAMTTLQKSAIGVALALVLGGGVYETTMFARQKSELANLEHRSTGLAAELRQARETRAATAGRLASVEAEIDARIAQSAARVSSGDAALEAQMKTWLAAVARVKELFDQRPNLRIPELALLDDEAWFDAASTAKLDSDDDVRKTLAQLRQKAESLMVGKVSAALRAFLQANNNTLPNEVAQLLPFFDPPIEAHLLSRYEMLRSGKLSEVSAKNQLEVIGITTLTDIEYDSFWKIGADRQSNTNAMTANVTEAKRAFAAVNPGQKATSAAQLLPHLKWPVAADVLEKYLHPAPYTAPAPDAVGPLDQVFGPPGDAKLRPDTQRKTNSP